LIQRAIAAMLRRNTGQALDDVRSHDGGGLRVGRVVRIALRVDITHRAVDTSGRHFEHGHAYGRVNAPAATEQQCWIVGGLDKCVRPEVELQSISDGDVGSAQFHHQAWTDIHVMRVLRATSKDVDIHQVSTDFLGEGFEIR
jgi:hypothetical protein